jgi:hypothetical protein
MRSDLKVLRLAQCGAVSLGLLVSLPLHAADYYVATTGKDDNAGTMAAPFLTVGRAQMAAAPGDTVYIGGGVYKFSGNSQTAGVSFTKSGTPDKHIKYFAVPGQVPVFDLFELTPGARVTGLDVNCSWIHLRGLEVKGVQQYQAGEDSWAVRVRGSNNIIENLNVHHNEAPGVFLTSGASNLVLNCDSHHNFDSLEDGGSGDGFGCHSSGGNNVFSGCRAYENSDDGFDFISANGTCTAEKSWAFRNGWEPDTMTAAGNGAGFKSGGFGVPADPTGEVPRHVIRFNVAFGNRSQGFYANHHPGPGGIDFLNNTAFDNASNFDMLADQGQSSHKLRNNVAFDRGGTVSRLTGGTDTSNSWSLEVTVSAADFQSMDNAEALAPRGPDGSLPNMSFLRLAAGSDLIDKGEDVGLPFNDAAPDLGAFEAGPPVGGGGGGGVSGMGGANGMAGAGGPAGSGGTATNGGTGVSVGGTTALAGAAGNGTLAQGGSAGSANAGGAATGMAPVDDAGCACRAAGGRDWSRSLGLFALATAGALVWRRRRATVMCS